MVPESLALDKTMQFLLDDPTFWDDSLQQIPSELVNTEDPTKKCFTTVHEEITVASYKLSLDLVKGFSHRAHQLKEYLVLSTTVLEVHEQVEDLPLEPKFLHDKLEDAENCARRDNLRVRELPSAITDLQGTITVFF